jgi:tRNA-binding protein
VSISIDDFRKADIQVGRIVTVEDIPTARKPMYRMTIDFGGQSKQCVGGIKGSYSKEELLGKTVVAVVNLEPKPVAGVLSECMVLAAFNESEISLLSPDRALPPGTKVG